MKIDNKRVTVELSDNEPSVRITLRQSGKTMTVTKEELRFLAYAIGPLYENNKGDSLATSSHPCVESEPPVR